MEGLPLPSSALKCFMHLVSIELGCVDALKVSGDKVAFQRPKQSHKEGFWGKE